MLFIENKRGWASGVLVTAMLVFAAVTMAEADAGRPGGAFTIATYNLKNATDVYDDPYTHDEQRPIKPHKELKQIADAIRALDADVVAFQEVETEGLLRTTVHEFLSDMGYEYVAVQPTNSDHGINIGVISRRPIVSITSHRHMDLPAVDGRQPQRFARDLMRATIRVDESRTIDIYIVHFKSRRSVSGDKTSTRWRVAEASAARQVIGRQLSTDPDAWVVLTGDFNATPDSPALDALLQPAARPMLIDPHSDLPEDRRITYLRKPHRSTIDYVLVSPALANRVIKGSARVLDDPKLLAGSDHAPVVVSFDLKR